MVRGRRYHLKVLTPYGDIEMITGRFIEKIRNTLILEDIRNPHKEYTIPLCCLFGVKTALWPNN